MKKRKIYPRIIKAETNLNPACMQSNQKSKTKTTTNSEHHHRAFLFFPLTYKTKSIVIHP